MGGFPRHILIANTELWCGWRLAPAGIAACVTAGVIATRGVGGGRFGGIRRYRNNDRDARSLCYLGAWGNALADNLPLACAGGRLVIDGNG